MEKDREIARLVNVLYRVARAARYAAWNNVGPDAARFLAAQYNKVLGRLKELEPAVAPLFTELPEGASPEVIRMAARELSAYFEDEPGDARGWHRARGCGARMWAGWPSRMLGRCW